MAMESKKRLLWDARLSPRADKKKNKLPSAIQDQLALLVKEMNVLGPYRVNWKNYGPLRKGGEIPQDAFHCHLKKGNPTFVACWRIVSKKDRRIEVYYVGTHEGSPY